jgi:hypothetical protein
LLLLLRGRRQTHRHHRGNNGCQRTKPDGFANAHASSPLILSAAETGPAAYALPNRAKIFSAMTRDRLPYGWNPAETMQAL